MSWLDTIKAAIRPAPKAPAAMVRRGYSGAEVSRLNADWYTAQRSADAEINRDLRLLRDRSRDLIRNNSHAAGAKRVFQDNVIGKGIRPHFRFTLADGVTEDKTTNAAIEATWWKWNKSKYCHTRRTLTFEGIQRQLIGEWFESGEAFLRKKVGLDWGAGVPLQYDVLEGEYCDHMFFGDGPEGQILQGIEYNGMGAPVAYWLYKEHPGNTYNRNMERVRVPAAEIKHFFVPDRPGQSRGAPRLAPVIQKMRDLGCYEEAEIMAAGAAANKLGFIESPEGEPTGAVSTDGKIYMENSPLSFEELPPGAKFQPWDPQHPSGNFAPFVDAALFSIASGIGISFESLTKNHSKTNFTSGRLSRLSEQDYFIVLQDCFVDQVLAWVMDDWIDLASQFATIKIPGYYASQANRDRALDSIQWLARGWEGVQPVAEINADIMALGAGLVTRSEILARRGKDFGDTLAQGARERDAAEKLNLYFTGDGRVQNGALNPLIAATTAATTTTAATEPAEKPAPAPVRTLRAVATERAH